MNGLSNVDAEENTKLARMIFKVDSDTFAARIAH